MPSHRILPNLTSQKTSKIVDHGEKPTSTLPPTILHERSEESGELFLPSTRTIHQGHLSSCRRWLCRSLGDSWRFQCEDIGRMGHVAFVKKECEEKSPKDHWICPVNKTQTNPIQWICCHGVEKLERGWVSAPRGLSFHQPLRAEHRSSTNEYPSAFSSLRAPEMGPKDVHVLFRLVCGQQILAPVTPRISIYCTYLICMFTPPNLGQVASLACFQDIKQDKCFGLESYKFLPLTGISHLDIYFTSTWHLRPLRPAWGIRSVRLLSRNAPRMGWEVPNPPPKSHWQQEGSRKAAGRLGQWHHMPPNGTSKP